MLIRTAKYAGSFVDVKACPEKMAIEFAFIGRSNVGKSSLINYVTNHKDLARTSSKPGKTQTLNFYAINDNYHLVDLPGYGFAAVSKEKRSDWEEMIEGYLLNRQQLACVFQLIDASIPVQQKDVDFTNWMGEHSIPFAIVFTKTDKREKTDGDTIAEYRDEMLKFWETLPKIIITSVKKNKGKEELLEYFDEIFKNV